MSIAIGAATVLLVSLLPAAAAAQARQGSDVRISELSNYGPAGSADEIIELTNYGDAPADLDGWQVYRCAASGSRAYDPQLPALAGVSLAPGASYLIANAAGTVDDADAYYEVSLADAGFGVWLEDADRTVVDTVAVYADPTDSECAIGDRPLPNDLDGRRNHSWQRVGDTGVDNDDFVRAERTPGAPNATEPDEPDVDSDVLISELVNGGPAGGSDDFVEFANYGSAPVDVGGWRFYRCWGSGRTTPDSLQTTIPAGTVLAPGGVFVAAHDSVAVPDGVAHARYPVSLANVGFGAMLVDPDGGVRDAVGVYETDGFHQPSTDSPCTRGEALPNRLDFGWDQTWQRTGRSGDNAADFAVGTRTLGSLAEPEGTVVEDVDTGVRVSELVNAGPGGGADDFFELANFGDAPVSLDGWDVYRCQEDGRRSPDRQIPRLDGVVLEPGQTYLAAHTSSSLAAEADASYGTGLAAGGFGLMVVDDRGRVADAVGVYHADFSPCTRGLSLANVVAAEAGDTFQRLDATGSNAVDFVTAAASPGELPEDLRRPTDFTADELAPVDVEPAPRPLAPDTAAVIEGDEATLSATAAHTTGGDAEVTFTGAERLDLDERATRVFTGVSDTAPPTTRRTDGEQRADEAVLDGGGTLVNESTESFPYQRFELHLDEPRDHDFAVTWSGASTGGGELQLYAWNAGAQQWERLDAAAGEAGGPITLTGTVAVPRQSTGRSVDLLVVNGPATEPGFSDDAAEPNRAFKDPAEYDFSLAYMTDTQFLSEGYRDAYAQMTRWIATNAEARSIAYTVHTGDLIQNWLNGPHSEARAADEFAFASDAMGVLDQAGMPYGVLPGNHDNKWGRDGALYNEYFPAERFAGHDWYGGAWREDDAQHHYDVMEIDGAPFLFLHLGYMNGDAPIEWARQVLAAHPDHNVVLATHEYLHPDGSLSTPDNYRWTSMADRYWEELIEPHDNVFLVLAGHHHGLAYNVKRDVDGVEGRTVVEMMANYQGFQDGGRFDTGFMRLLQFDVDAGLMAVNTFSPDLDEHNAGEYTPEDIDPAYVDADDEFTVEVDLNDRYDKRVATALMSAHEPAATVGTATVADGADAVVPWTGLTWCADYVWSVEAAAEGRHARGEAAVLRVDGRGGRDCG